MDSHRRSLGRDIGDDVRLSLATITALLGTTASGADLSSETRQRLARVRAEVRGLAELCDRLLGDDTGRDTGPAGADVLVLAHRSRPAPRRRGDAISIEDLAPALRQRRSVAERADHPSGQGDEQDGRIDSLTKQERRILALIARGHTNRQIGEEMFLAEKTVKNYVSNLLRKLGLERRTQAAVYATQLAHAGARPAPGRSTQSGWRADLAAIPS